MVESKSFRQDLRRDGYSKEEEYFNRINQEFIWKRRQQLSEERVRRQAEQERRAHWMRCPMCGSELKETALLGIMVNQCQKCEGVYLDAAEAKTLIETREPKTFLKRLKTLFKVKETDNWFF